jgi:hypothetical protein
VYGVIRTQILLDPATHAALKKAAAAQGKGLSALARELLGAALRGTATKRGSRRYDWTFVGMAHGGPGDVAERHDDYLNRGERW